MTRLAVRLAAGAWIVVALLSVVSPARGQPRVGTAAPSAAAGPVAAAPVDFGIAIYFLDRPAEDPLALLRRRSGPKGGAPTLVAKVPEPATAPVVAARLEAVTADRFAPPGLDLVTRFGRGLSREQAERLQSARQVLVLRFAHPAASRVAALRAALETSESLARGTGGLLYDIETREIFTADAWHERRLATWTGAIPSTADHTVIHAYKSDQGQRQVRAITLGMAKFGLPDIVVDDFAWSLNAGVGRLINGFGQALLEGTAPAVPGPFDLDPRWLRDTSPAARGAASADPSSASRPVARLQLLRGRPEAGDPENRLVEIAFDRYPGKDRYVRQSAMLTGLFGSEDRVSRIRHDDELLAASQAARKKLPALRAAFARGLPPGEHIQLKAPFATRSGGNEWMWVEVLTWSGDAITGLLRNEPVDVAGLKGGETVDVSERRVFDYIHTRADGRQEGNETSRVIARMQGQRR